MTGFRLVLPNQSALSALNLDVQLNRIFHQSTVGRQQGRMLPCSLFCLVGVCAFEDFVGVAGLKSFSPMLASDF